MDDQDFLHSAFQKSNECLRPDELEAMATPDRQGVSATAQKHLETCASCQAELALLREFELGDAKQDELVAVRQIEGKLRSRPEWRSGEAVEASWFSRLFTAPGKVGLALASMTAVLMIGVYLGRTPRTGGVDPISGGDNVRSGQVEGIEPGGDIPQAPQTLRWKSVAGAQYYEIRLMEVDETVLWQGRADQPEWVLPEAVRALMTQRKALFWVVSAHNPQGERIAVSSRVRFRVMPEAK